MAISQDLGDIADVVLTKLRENDGANECLSLSIYAEKVYARKEETTRLKRVCVDGKELWRLWATTGPSDALPTELPAVKSAHTAIRLALGRIYNSKGTTCGSFRVKMVVETGMLEALLFDELVDSEHNCRLVFEQELEMVRLLDEMEKVQMVPLESFQTE